MRRTFMTHLIGVAAAISLMSPAVAASDRKGGPQGRGGRHGAKVEKPEVQDEQHEVKAERREVRPRVEIDRRTPPRPRQVVIIDHEGNRRVISEFVSREGLPPGLAKRDTLPPGLRKQLRERGHLPPGLEKRLTPVPAPLIARLPAVPPHFTRFFAGRDLVIVDRRTDRIAAIIPDVLPR